MKPGDILLLNGEKTPLSKIIARGTNSKYSHVAVCVSPKLDLTIEATAGAGVRARSICKIPKIYDIFRAKKRRFS